MRYRFDTRCVHGTPDRAYEDGARSVSFPIYQSATFARPLPFGRAYFAKRSCRRSNLRLRKYTHQLAPRNTRLSR